MTSPHRGMEPLRLMACKVIMRAHVSSAAKAAAAVLIDHVNWTDYRCDPSLARIARLSGYARSNVQAGIDQLENERLVVVRVHGGLMGRNQHDFNWTEIRRRDAEMQTALHSRRRVPHGQGVSDPGLGAQTRSYNPVSEPVGRSLDNKRYGTGSITKWHTEGGRGRYLPNTATPREVADAAAERHWDADLRQQLDKSTYVAIVPQIDEAVRAAATTAEMRRRGAGVELILERVAQRARGSCDDPSPRGGFGRRGTSSLSAILKPKVEPKEGAKELPTGDASASPDEARVLSGALPLAVDSDPDDEPVRPGKTRVDDG